MGERIAQTTRGDRGHLVGGQSVFGSDLDLRQRAAGLEFVPALI